MLRHRPRYIQRSAHDPQTWSEHDIVADRYGNHSLVVHAYDGESATLMRLGPDAAVIGRESTLRLIALTDGYGFHRVSELSLPERWESSPPPSMSEDMPAEILAMVRGA
jgi:hypothetical protein